MPTCGQTFLFVEVGHKIIFKNLIYKSLKYLAFLILVKPNSLKIFSRAKYLFNTEKQTTTAIYVWKVNVF
jgi:hypothetical protein